MYQQLNKRSNLFPPPRCLTFNSTKWNMHKAGMKNEEKQGARIPAETLPEKER